MTSVTRSRIAELATRGRDASARTAREVTLAKVIRFPTYRHDERQFPRCPARPVDHQAYRVGHEVHCSYCNDVWDSDGKGGYARVAGRRALERKHDTREGAQEGEP